MLSLLIFGGATLQDFAFAMLVGIASGTYSSIFIASPVLTAWKEREPGFVRRRLRIAEARGQRVPAFADDIAVAKLGDDDEPKRRSPQSSTDRQSPRPEPRGRAAGRRGRHRRARDAPSGNGGRPDGSDGEADTASAERRERNAERRARRQAAPQTREERDDEQLMALLVWFTMGIALWHFTVFLPDHFWQGIVGAFVGAVLGAVIFGLIVAGDQRQEPRRHRPRHGAARRSPARRSARRRLRDRHPRTSSAAPS